MWDFKLSYRVHVNAVLISSRPIFHIVAETTQICTASSLQNQTTTNIWKKIQYMRIFAHFCSPSYLFVVQRSAYMSKKLRKVVEVFELFLDEALIKTPSAIQAVKSYPARLQVPYKRIFTDSDRKNCCGAWMLLAVFAVIFTVALEDLCPVCLVLDSLPRLIMTISEPSQLQNAKLFASFTKEVRKHQKSRKISFELKHKEGPKEKEHSTILLYLLSKSPLFVC